MILILLSAYNNIFLWDGDTIVSEDGSTLEVHSDIVFGVLDEGWAIVGVL